MPLLFLAIIFFPDFLFWYTCQRNLGDGRNRHSACLSINARGRVTTLYSPHRDGLYQQYVDSDPCLFTDYFRVLSD